MGERDTNAVLSASSTQQEPPRAPKSVAPTSPPCLPRPPTDRASLSGPGPANGTSPPPAGTQALNHAVVEQHASLPAIDTSLDSVRGPVVHIRTPSHQTPTRSPLAAGLHIRTDLTTPTPASTLLDHPATTTLDLSSTPHSFASTTASSQPIAIERPRSRSKLSATSMNSSHSLSPRSAFSSPALAAMTDITPLPSPILLGGSPGSWKRGGIRRGSAGSLSSSVRDELLPEHIPDTPTRISPAKVKKSAYASLMPGSNSHTRGDVPSHTRNRSLSEFSPEAMHNVRHRHVTVSASHGPLLDVAQIEPHLHREQYLAEQRGLIQRAHSSASSVLPTPPPSNRSVTESEGDDAILEEEPFTEYLTVTLDSNQRRRRYRPVRPLGQGTFSKVVLATSERLPPNTVLNESSEKWLSPNHLVAIKIVQHGPAGGADEERIELGLKREVELLRLISHPSIIHLEAFDWHEHEALLVLNYCPGGDLFDLASQHLDVLSPALVQRMFAELVGAVSYLHSKLTVHRDIKLENVLLNVPATSLAEITSPSTYTYPLITLTDLGLSRTIPSPPESPLLTTRCGSEDYAAPEILLSQPYDGRKTDAWALGVLLYALMEGRLPFDPPPVPSGSKPIRGRSRATHRIARCDWIWCKFGDEDGDWDAERGTGWEGARACVEGLLKKVTRGRLSIDELGRKDYLREAIQVEGGLKRPHINEPMDES